MFNEETDAAYLPSIFGKNRNVFQYHKPIETTFNVGEICPIYCNLLIEPGDTISIDMSSIIKTTTLRHPTNQSLIAEIFWFSQEKLNLFDKDKEVHGENTEGEWYATSEKQYPIIEIPTVESGNAIDTHHILAHLGFPIQVGGYSGTKMGLDMYLDCYNEWFRNETTTPPIRFDKSETNKTYDGTSSLLGGPLLKANKLPDYFVNGIPTPQKAASATTLPIGDKAIVYGDYNKAINLQTYYDSQRHTNTGYIGIDNTRDGNAGNYLSLSQQPGGSLANLSTQQTEVNDNNPRGWNIIDKADSHVSSVYADLTTATAAAWNAIRVSAVTQQIYEADAYFGSRVREIIKSRYKVNTKADVAHIPEFLGATRFPLDQWQVPQSSETISSGSSVPGSGLGELGAYSQTAHVHHAFTKSFDYWSVIMGVVVVRYKHIYAQGLPAQYSKRRRFDFRQPEMEHLGFTATYNRELYMTGVAQVDDGAFNYRPIYQEYRFEPGESTGEFNPSYSLSLDFMSYVDDYDNADGSVGNVPVFAQEWTEENPNFIDRSLAVAHTEADQIQLVGDIKVTKVSELAQYGLPGLTRF